MEVELLYFDGCPSWTTALDHVVSVLADEGVPVEVRLTRVDSHEQAVAERFVGSPTIRLNGRDLFPTGGEDYALGCRVYATPDGLRGWPTRDMLRAALAGA